MAFPSEKILLICGRVGDPQCSPTPGSTQFDCCDCGHAVMASPDTTKNHRANGTPIVCVQCYARHRDEGNPTILLRQQP